MGESMTDRTQIETEAQLQSCGIELRIMEQAWEKIMAYCRATNLEVSGFLLMTREGNELTIKDAYIVEQESTGTSTEMASTAIARLQMELFKKKIIGQDENTKLAHFHTHPTFGVFWSTTDMILRRTMAAGTDYSVALVVNQKGEALAAIDINGEFPMSINNLPITILETESEVVAACRAEVKAKVKEPTPAWVTPGERYYRPVDGGDLLPMGARTGELLPGMAGYGLPGIDPRVKPDGTTDRMEGESWGAFRKRAKAMRRAQREALRGTHGRLAADVAAFERQMLGQSEDEDVRLSLTEEELALGRRMTAGDDGIWSDDEGTWANIGGEVVKIGTKDGEPLA